MEMRNCVIEGLTTIFATENLEPLLWQNDFGGASASDRVLVTTSRYRLIVSGAFCPQSFYHATTVFHPLTKLDSFVE